MKSLSGLIPEGLFIEIFDYDFILIESLFLLFKERFGYR